jgi:hypothetical protein
MHMGQKGRDHELLKFFLEPKNIKIVAGDKAVIGEFPADVVLRY